MVKLADQLKNKFRIKLPGLLFTVVLSVLILLFFYSKLLINPNSIYFSDKGDGINAKDKEKLFESFHRIQKHELAGIAGTGLGLSVCKTLVEAHGGSMWVESEPGHGSAFSFSLPYR